MHNLDQKMHLDLKKLDLEIYHLDQKPQTPLYTQHPLIYIKDKEFDSYSYF